MPNEELTRRPDGGAPWRHWGPVPLRAGLGHGARGLQRGRRAWGDFPHDHARSRAFRWNEDGLGGICDDRQMLCFALAFWNGGDPILKERIFGLTGPEGNHGEDAKEYWWYLDSTPTHSWMRWRYLYPQAGSPTRDLVPRTPRVATDPEFELSTRASSTRTATGTSQSTTPRPAPRQGRSWYPDYDESASPIPGAAAPVGPGGRLRAGVKVSLIRICPDSSQVV